MPRLLADLLAPAWQARVDLFRTCYVGLGFLYHYIDIER